MRFHIPYLFCRLFVTVNDRYKELLNAIERLVVVYELVMRAHRHTHNTEHTSAHMVDLYLIAEVSVDLTNQTHTTFRGILSVWP